MRLENEQVLWYLWILPALLGIVGYSFWRKRTLLGAFAEARLLRSLNRQVSAGRQFSRAGLILLAVALIIVALTQPGWNKQPQTVQRKGRDLVVLLDVSRSMLAEDIKPNRLERVKLDLLDLIDNLRGDRIGLIAFAGTGVIKCPLTQDYGFAKIALSEITTDSVAVGGTKIGDAIRDAVGKVFDDQERDFKDILLFTDGEDHDSFPVEAAQKAAQKGIRIFVIGIGDEKAGSLIPVTEDGRQTYQKYQGELVRSKLNASLLREIALATPGGHYLNVAAGSTYDLVEFYKSLIAAADRKMLEAATVWRYEEKYQIFLGMALMFLLIEMLIGERKKELPQ